MTRAEILEARRLLQQTRMDFLRLETEKYDATISEYDTDYYAALGKLQDECGRLGHGHPRAGRCSTCDKYLGASL